jgi:hypothetical protein
VWQSFDHPTDALLVGQSLRPGARLVANSSAADWAPSRLYLAVADDSLSAYADAKQPQRYYHLGFSKVTGAYATYANGSLAVFDPATAPAASAPLVTIQLPAVGAGTVQYMRLEHDGHLRVYEWNPAGWAPVQCWTSCASSRTTARSRRCAARTACARTCSAAAPTRPTSGGPTAAASRRRRRWLARLVSLPGLAYFNDPATSLRALERVSDAACRKACLDECRCAAAQFVYGGDAGDGFCYLQSEVLSMETSRPEVVHYNSGCKWGGDGQPAPHPLKPQALLELLRQPTCDRYFFVGCVAARKVPQTLVEFDNYC